MASKNGFSSGIGQGCGCVIGVIVALILIPIVGIGTCGTCAYVATRDATPKRRAAPIKKPTAEQPRPQAVPKQPTPIPETPPAEKDEPDEELTRRGVVLVFVWGQEMKVLSATKVGDKYEVVIAEGVKTTFKAKDIVEVKPWPEQE